MHETYKKRFPNEDSSGLFNQEKCATIHISRHRKQLSRRFHFQTFYIVQQLHRAINSFCRDCSSLRAIFFFFFQMVEVAGPVSSSEKCADQRQPSQDISRTPQISSVQSPADRPATAHRKVKPNTAQLICSVTCWDL